MPHMKWPPQIKEIKYAGEVTDASPNNYRRDGGRPAYLGGNTYYIFADTFCHDQNRQFVGITNNTAALVPDPRSNPVRCHYWHHEAHQPAFIPHAPSEHQYETEAVNLQQINRVVNWSMGGIIEDAAGSSTGWIFFEKMLTHGSAAGRYFGMGVGRVSVQPDKSLRVDRVMGEDLIFGENEPHFGTMTYFIEDGYVYLLGQKDPPAPTLDLHNHWTRIRQNVDFTKHENYEFLLSNGQWSPNYQLDQLMNIMPVQAQGAIIKVPELAPEGRPYMWFGVNKFCASRVFIACAPRLEGPWEEWQGPEIPKNGGGGMRYCLYPHERSCNPAAGQMLVSWSDDKNLGAVVCQAMLEFVMEGEQGGPVQVTAAKREDSAFEKGKTFLKRLME